MRLTLIALLLAGVVGCDSMPQGLSASAQAVFRRAQQGDADAQYNLGVMYDDGEGVPKDEVEAYAWYSLAATNGDELMKEQLNEALPRMKAALAPEQLIAAEKRAAELTEQINANKAK